MANMDYGLGKGRQFLIMPVARLELARANPADFESAVSTNSTIPAFAR